MDEKEKKQEIATNLDDRFTCFCSPADEREGLCQFEDCLCNSKSRICDFELLLHRIQPCSHLLAQYLWLVSACRTRRCSQGGMDHCNGCQYDLLIWPSVVSYAVSRGVAIYLFFRTPPLYRLRLTWCTGSCNGFFKQENQLLLFCEWEEALNLSKMGSIGWVEQRCGEVSFRICADFIVDKVLQSIIHEPNLVLKPVTNLPIATGRGVLGVLCARAATHLYCLKREGKISIRQRHPPSTTRHPNPSLRHVLQQACQSVKDHDDSVARSEGGGEKKEGEEKKKRLYPYVYITLCTMECTCSARVSPFSEVAGALSRVICSLIDPMPLTTSFLILVNGSR